MFADIFAIDESSKFVNDSVTDTPIRLFVIVAIENSEKSANDSVTFTDNLADIFAATVSLKSSKDSVTSAVIAPPSLKNSHFEIGHF